MSTARNTSTPSLKSDELWRLHHDYRNEEEAADALCDFRDEMKKVELDLAAANERVRVLERRESIFIDAMSEVSASSGGQSSQPIGQIVAGCISELAALAKTHANDRKDGAK